VGVKAIPLLALLAALQSLPSLPDLLPWKPHLPAWAERWLYNPRERTERVIEAMGKDDPNAADTAVGPADTAVRIAEDDPQVRFNAGTAHLAAGHERQAVKLLEEAAKKAGPELSPTAHYNLGNAKLAAGDAAGAVEAYKKTLRADPGNADAKFNLEIALREREKPPNPLRAPREGSRGQRRGEKDPSNQGGAGNATDQSDKRSDASNPGTSDRSGEGQRSGQAGPPSLPQGGRQPLPNYKDQPDMSAREAAALLSAVENLERQQRRAEAARRARERVSGAKDW